MICIKCSAEIPDGSRFCNLCGARQEKPAHGVKKRGNGQGSVYKHGDTWTAEVTMGYQGKKRIRRRKYGFRTKKEALAYIETLRSASAKKDTITMSELWEIYKDGDYQSLSESKQKSYRIAWNKVADKIGFMHITDLTVPQLQKLLDETASSHYTAADIKKVLSNLYKIAIRDDYEDKNRMSFVKLPPAPEVNRTTFTEEEIEFLWDHSGNYLVKCILIMLYTGMRPGELIGMKKENIHLSEHYMTGGIKTKKSKARKIIIHDRIVPILEEMMRSDAKTLTTYRSIRTLEADWYKLKERYRMRSDLVLYCCRHTYVSRLTALKLSPAMLQELVGHTDYETTLIYTHLSVEDRLNEVNKMG